MSSNALPRGYRLDEYVIDSVLGTGGFGITYKAQDSKLGTRVAIKEYFPQWLARRNDNLALVPGPAEAARHYEWGRQQFLKEVRALARFRHHNIVRVLRFLERNGTAYMIMEYESGQGLHDYLSKHGRADERTLMQAFIPLLNGLQAVHQAGVLHLDIKPENIYLRTDMTPVLIDFGASRQVAQPSDADGVVALSLAYAAIEQYPPLGKLGPWTDIYSIGASLYRCVSGNDPVSANTRLEVTRDGLPDPLTPAAALDDRGYSVYLRECIDWAMQLDASRRPQDALAFQDALMGKGIAGKKPVPAKRPQPPAPVVKPVPAAPAKSPSPAAWTVVDSVTESAAPPSSSAADADFVPGIPWRLHLRRALPALIVLAVIAGAFLAFNRYPDSFRQLSRALPIMASLFDRAKEMATGEQKSGEVRYVGGVDPVPEERKGE